MPKTLKDKIAMLSTIVSLASLFIGHVIPPAWLQGITAWRFCFGLSCIVLLVWAVDRFIIEPIRQAIAAISSLEKAVTTLTCSLGTLMNRVESVNNSIASYFESTRVSLNNLPERISILLETKTKKSVENSK